MSKNAPDRLQEAISASIRVYKITETGSGQRHDKKHLNPADMQALLFVADRAGCIANDVIAEDSSWPEIRPRLLCLPPGAWSCRSRALR
jgi:hypothetical protein